MKKKTFLGIIALLLAAGIVIVCGIGSQVNGKWFKNPDIQSWFNNWGISRPADDKEQAKVVAVSEDGNKFLFSNTYAMPRAMTMVGKQSVYSKSSTFNLTASLSNQYINGKFDWSVDFVDPAAEWAMGKSAEYYVQAIPISDGSATATIKYLQNFGEQIKVTATLRDTDSSDSCTIDCLEQWIMPEQNGSSSVFTVLGDEEEGFELYIALVKSSIGTVRADTCRLMGAGNNIELDDRFVTLVKSYLKFDIGLTYEVKTKFSEFVTEVHTQTFDPNGYWELDNTDCDNRPLRYSDFIDNFDSFDDEHKQAIYYAWYHAALDFKSAGHSYNIAYSPSLAFVVNGVEVPFTCNEIINFEMGQFLGKDVKPSVTLNRNVIF